MKYIIFIISILVYSTNSFGAACSNIIATTESCDSITQYGITWTLSASETVFQFYNGDYGIIDDGSVTVSSVSPVASGTGATYVNGSQKNPTTDGDQGFDGRATNYNSTESAAFPLTLSAGDALLSSVSITTETENWAGDSLDSHVYIKSVAVLTVMASGTYTDKFRPAYVDRSQTIYDSADINASILPTLSTTGLTVPSHTGYTALEYYERGLQRPWVTFLDNWTARASHAADNMFGYHREVSRFLGETLTMMMADTTDKTDLIKYFIQLGIDYYHVGILGEGDSSFYVMPVILTGKLLNNSNMYNAFIDGRLDGTTYGVPRDYPDFYYYADRNDTTESAVVTAGESWQGRTVFFRNSTLANRGFEHLHPSEWDTLGSGSTTWTDESYRVGIDSHVHGGHIFAALVMGLKTEWDHDATFDYIDYWMDMSDADHASECSVKATYHGTLDCASYGVVKRSGNTFIDEMWDTYRSDYSDVQASHSMGQGFTIKGATIR